VIPKNAPPILSRLNLSAELAIKGAVEEWPKRIAGKLNGAIIDRPVSLLVSRAMSARRTRFACHSRLRGNDVTSKAGFDKVNVGWSCLPLHAGSPGAAVRSR
jgi:hypothetical protein